MGARKGRHEVISFKADESLIKAMAAIPNRSEFIRSAVLAALDGVCPLCQGTGILSAEQKDHWRRFSQSHHLEECDQCHAWHLVCSEKRKADHHGQEGAGS
ncbi:hypothetical protein AAU61_00625 [Desulfocarbo indianensis]|nr:hypothetical protein AAU61_00625 [Desulfocarbo indianensis]